MIEENIKNRKKQFNVIDLSYEMKGLFYMDRLDKKGFIFFDMDETLGFFRNYDGSMNEKGFPDGIYLRPGIKSLLNTLKNNFVLSVSTAATKKYTHFVLEQSGLLDCFDYIFTRDQFVKLENNSELDNEASPAGFEKQYSMLINQLNEKGASGIVIGDNDYDISSDTPGLPTLIIDSLFMPIDIILAVVVDYFNHNDMDYSELGIDVKKFKKKHPITGIESTCFEVKIPDSLYHSQLEKIAIKIPKRRTSSRRDLSKHLHNRIQKSHGPAMFLKANRFGLMK